MLLMLIQPSLRRRVCRVGVIAAKFASVTRVTCSMPIYLLKINKVAYTLVREGPESGTDFKALWLLTGQHCWSWGVHFSICVFFSTQDHYKRAVRVAKTSDLIYFFQ